jgi:hypothetical protein
MEFLKLYYITVPLLSYNLCYTMTTLSNSITSSKNIMNFFIETKETDINIFKNHLEEIDLKTKIKIIESLIYDIIKKHGNNEKPKIELKNLISMDCELDDENNFYLVEVKSNHEYLKNIDEPVLYSLISTCEVIYHINDNLQKINEKIMLYERSYLKSIVVLKLQPELSNIIRYSKILDIRLKLLFDILKVYSSINKI